jgi:hypothetical protein
MTVGLAWHGVKFPENLILKKTIFPKKLKARKIVTLKLKIQKNFTL